MPRGSFPVSALCDFSHRAARTLLLNLGSGSARRGLSSLSGFMRRVARRLRFATLFPRSRGDFRSQHCFQSRAATPFETVFLPQSRAAAPLATMFPRRAWTRLAFESRALPFYGLHSLVLARKPANVSFPGFTCDPVFPVRLLSQPRF